MGDSNSANLFGNFYGQTGGFVKGKIKLSDFLTPDYVLLPLPADFDSYSWNNASPAVDGVQVPMPELDKILTEYAQSRFKIVFTAEFIKFVGRQFSFLTSEGNSKFGYAVNLYSTISGFALSIHGAEISKIISLYFSRPIDLNPFSTQKNPFDKPTNPFANQNNLFSNPTNSFNILINLKLPLDRIEREYLEKLSQKTFQYPIKGKPNGSFKFDTARAQFYIEAVNTEMEQNIDVYFINARARALTIYSDDVKNDERFVASMHDAGWNEYDETIKQEVAYYNQRFAGVAGFVPLDWRYVKAMIWTEVMAGPRGNAEQWTKFPMQIGRFTQDAGYDVISGKAKNPADIEKMQFVSPQLMQEVQNKNNVVSHLNVRAGIAYLYIRAIDSVEDKPDVILNSQILIDKILPNEGLAAFARRNGTTVANILLNQEVDSTKLQPGQDIKFQKAQSVRGIRNWKDWRTTIRGYNGDAELIINPKTNKQEKKGSGDVNYLQKLDKAYQIIKSRQ